MQLKECKKRQLKGRGRQVWSEGVLLGSRVGEQRLHLRSPHYAGILRLRTNTVLADSCDIAACTNTNALCLEQWGHLWPQLMEKGLEVDPNGKVGFRLLSKRGICLQFRLKK